MKNNNFLIILFFLFSIHLLNGFENVYKVLKRSYLSRMQITHGYCGKESFGFYNEMINKYKINEYQNFQKNYESFPLLRGLFYIKDVKFEKKFILLLNFPFPNQDEFIELEGKKFEIRKLKLLEQKNNCFLYEYN